VPTAYLRGASQPKVGDAIVEIDPRYFRPTEVSFLQGDATKARKKLCWEPKVRFKELARIMVEADIKDLEEMKHCQDVIRKLSGNNSKQ
jgi:GDPmannose 4,6-dehydratase